MTTFILLSKVSMTAVDQVTNLADMDRMFDQELAERLPQVKRVASYALLGTYDFMHIFEAPDATTAAQVALLVNRFGGGTSQTLTAIPFSEFRELARDISAIQVAR